MSASQERELLNRDSISPIKSEQQFKEELLGKQDREERAFVSIRKIAEKEQSVDGAADGHCHQACTLSGQAFPGKERQF